VSGLVDEKKRKKLQSFFREQNFFVFTFLDWYIFGYK